VECFILAIFRLNLFEVFAFYGLQISTKLSLLLLQRFSGFFLTDYRFTWANTNLLDHSLVVPLLFGALGLFLLNFHGKELNFLLEFGLFFLEVVFKQLFFLLKLLAKLV